MGKYLQNLQIDSQNLHKSQNLQSDLQNPHKSQNLQSDLQNPYKSQNLPKFSDDFRKYIISRTQDSAPNALNAPKTRFIDKLTKDKIANKFLNLYLRFVRFLIPPSLRDEIFIQTSIGERHKWAYDELSLTRMLQNAGFGECKRFEFNTSQILHFNEFLLDCNEGGGAYKGASLYVETRK
ncbi:hypothetical protein ACWIUD_05140 [Helicobacter sp. 23-1044]